MRRLIKFLFQFLLFLAIGFSLYATFAHLPAPVASRSITVPLPSESK